MKMTRRRWALVAWGAFLATLIGVTAVEGGRHCQVPSSGPFHWLLKGHVYIQTHATYWRLPACREVK
jgi:hypothetical protein